MDEAMRCDRVALIQNGNILAIDSPQQISNGFGRRLFSIKSANKYSLITALRSMNETVSAFPFGEAVHVTFIDDRVPLNIAGYLARHGVADAAISGMKPGIEDRFLELMQTGDEAAETLKTSLT
jgi:ABC-type multidrug transport system ATPase subunit